MRRSSAWAWAAVAWAMVIGLTISYVVTLRSDAGSVNGGRIDPNGTDRDSLSQDAPTGRAGASRIKIGKTQMPTRVTGAKSAKQIDPCASKKSPAFVLLFWIGLRLFKR